MKKEPSLVDNEKKKSRGGREGKNKGKKGRVRRRKGATKMDATINKEKKERVVRMRKGRPKWMRR